MNSERIPVAFLFFILPNLITITASRGVQSCLNKGNYTDNNSTYRANLDAVLATLPSNIPRNGFYHASAGEDPDIVNAIVLCRGDVKLDACQKCVRKAIIDLPNSCPYQKQAIIWFGNCMVSYSDAAIYQTLSITGGQWRRSSKNATSPEQFKQDLASLLDDVRTKANDGDSGRKVVAGRKNGPDLQTIYALLQCTPDIDSEDCNDCLSNAVVEAQSCCGTSRGARVLKPSCNLRFEVYPFFNETNLQGSVVVHMPAIQKPQSPAVNINGGNGTRIIIISVVTIIAVSAMVVVIVAVLLRRRRNLAQIKQHESEDLNEISTVESLQHAFSIIRDATNNFSEGNKLREGRFGTVYKGILANGQEIAVKRLFHNSGQGSSEFKNEIHLLARILHRNLVKLLGFCIDGKEKLIVYEFVPNGSLDHFIFDPVDHSYLDWNKRFKIIWGIAKGLLYLHEDSQLKIIHRDLKASNILLDRDMIPKIAGFGTAKLVDQDETQGKMNSIAGTQGYMSPEYAMNGHFSVKSDVFSFGVLVLEIISGQENINAQSEESASNLLSTVWKNWRDGTSVNTVDPFLRSDSGFMQDMVKCIHIGLLCVQQNTADRPTMASVVLMLNSITITMAVPSEPAFYFESGDGSINISTQKAKNLEVCIQPQYDRT